MEKKLKKFYDAMEDLNDVFNGFPPELSLLLIAEQVISSFNILITAYSYYFL